MLDMKFNKLLGTITLPVQQEEMRKSILDLQSRIMTPAGMDLQGVPAGMLPTHHPQPRVREEHRTTR